MKKILFITTLSLLSSLFAFTITERIDMLIKLKEHKFSSEKLESEWQTRLDNQREDSQNSGYGKTHSLLDIRFSDIDDFAKALEKEYTTQINYSKACFDYRMESIEHELEVEMLNSREEIKLNFTLLKYFENEGMLAINVDTFDKTFATKGDLYINSYINEYPDTCFVKVTKEYQGYDQWSYFNWKLVLGEMEYPFSNQRVVRTEVDDTEIPESPFEKDSWEYEKVEYDTTGIVKEFSVSDSLLALEGQSKLAVIIGLSDYEYLPSYKYADSDAKLVKDRLQKLLFIPNSNIYYATNADFKGFADLFKDYGWLMDKTEKDTLDLYLYFAGNGCSIDGQAALLESNYNFYLPDMGATKVDTLIADLNKYNLSSITLFLDTNFATLNNQNIFITNSLDELPPAVGMSVIPDNVSIFYGANTRGKSYLLEDYKQNLFTRAFVESLQAKSDRNRDKYVTLNELEARISSLCKKYGNELGISQHPRLQSSNGNKMFFRLDNPYK